MAHDCSYCIFHCMDFRIQKTVDDLLKSLEVKDGQFDRISVPGGAGNLGQLVADSKLSKDLHHTEHFLLTVHEDCGAGATKQDLIDAFAAVKVLYPDRHAQAFYIYLDGTWEEISE